jgi:hypothetical protein
MYFFGAKWLTFLEMKALPSRANPARWSLRPLPSPEGQFY